MNYGNQNDRNRGQRDYQRYDPERSGSRRSEESFDERGYERGSYAGRYGFRGDPESGPYDYEREDRFSGRPSRQDSRGGFGAGPEDRGDAREWSSPRYTGGYSPRFSHSPESGRDWRDDDSGSRGGFSGSDSGRWSSQGWSSPGSSERGWSGQGSYGQGGYARYGSGREGSGGFGGRSDSSESWQLPRGDASSESSARGSQGRSSFDGSTYGRTSSTGEQARSHQGKGPKGYRRSDERIKEDACEALEHDHDVDATEITCQVREGIVTLTGEVDSRRAKRAAEDCVERLSGVEDVINQLRVGSKRDGDGSGSKRESESSSINPSANSNPPSLSNAGKRPETSSNTTR